MSKKKIIQRQNALKKLKIALVVTIIFMIGEFIGGYLANSLAILTDATHLLSDVSGYAINIIAIYVSKIKSNQNVISQQIVILFFLSHIKKYINMY